MKAHSATAPKGAGLAWSWVLVLASVALAFLVVVPAAQTRPAPSGSMKINGGVLRTNVTAVTITSNFTTVTQIRFCNSGGTYSAWEPYKATKAWSLPVGDGVKIINGQYKSTGKAITKSAGITLDTTAPVLATLASPSHPVETTWYGGPDVTMDWTAAADLSGVVGYSWTLDASAATDPDTVSEGPAATAIVTVVADGVWYFHVRALDAAGNWGATIHRAVQIDATAPTTTDDYDGVPRKLVTFTLAPSDALSGVALTEYRIDGGRWVSGTSVTLRKLARHKVGGYLAGPHSVDYRSTDGAGNVESVSTLTVTL